MSNDRGSDPMLPIGTNRCKCSQCGEYFTGPWVFDLHRASSRRVGHCVHPDKDLDTKGKPKFRLTDTGHWATFKRRLVE